MSCEYSHQKGPIIIAYGGKSSKGSNLFLPWFSAPRVFQKEALHCSNHSCYPLYHYCSGKQNKVVQFETLHLDGYEWANILLQKLEMSVYLGETIIACEIVSAITQTEHLQNLRFIFKSIEEWKNCHLFKWLTPIALQQRLHFSYLKR